MYEVCIALHTFWYILDLQLFEKKKKNRELLLQKLAHVLEKVC